MSNTVKPVHKFTKTFECIQYPAITQNMDRTIKTLGGISKMSEVLGSKNSSRLELKFRPEDVYCKPCAGDKVQCTGLLLNLKITKKKKKSGTAKIVVVPQVLGNISSCYQFKSLCDFQYLPVEEKSDGTVEDLLPRLVIDKNRTIENILNDETDLFLPPVMFSKVDIPQTNLKLFHELNASSQDKTTIPENVIGKKRKKREIYTMLISFDEPTVPSETDEKLVLQRYIQCKLITEEDIRLVRKVFDERPICSKNVVRYISKVQENKIKIILPMIAYYFYTGPYRILWCKLGYDPRKDSSTGKYQCLDFRIRTSYGMNVDKIAMRRQEKLIRLAMTSSLANLKHKTKDNKTFPEKYFCYKPGDVPPFRQMYYQYCDIHIPEVEELLESTPLLPKCHEKSGWYPDHVADKIRDIINEYVMNELSGIDDSELDSKSIDSGDMDVDINTDDEMDIQGGLRIGDSNSSDTESESGEDDDVDVKQE